MKTKECTVCRQVLVLDAFGTNGKTGIRASCKDCEKKRKADYYIKNRCRIIEDKREYYVENKEKIIKSRYIEDVKKLANDESYRLKINIARLIRSSLSRKGFAKQSRTVEILGCDIPTFRLHLESQFQPGMSWSNRGLYGWHIDHILPISSANCIEDIIKLNHYSNLQPLWAQDNLRKGCKIKDITEDFNG